jgi:aspartate-semialdehyde dehydrogenase
VVGATGVLGREILARLSDAGDELQEEVLGGDVPSLFATGQSAGEAFPWIEDEELGVEPWSPESARGLDVALVAVPPAATPPIVERLRELGVVAIDASPVFRATAPLFFEEQARPSPLTATTLLSLPSPESLALARILSAWVKFVPSSLDVTVLKAVAGSGQAGINDLGEATGRLLNGQEPDNPLHGHRIAFNLIPQVGAFRGAECEAEADLGRDLGRLLGQALPTAATCAWGPWFYGDFLSGTVSFESDVSLADLRVALNGRAQLKLLDDPASAVYPMPALATGDDATLVGRLRVHSSSRRRIGFVAAFDGARSVAANAIAALGAVARARRTH